MLRNLASVRFIVEIIRHALSNDLYDHDGASREFLSYLRMTREEVNIIKEISAATGDPRNSYGL